MRASRLLRATGGKNSALASASCAARNAPFFAALTKKTVASVGGFLLASSGVFSRRARVVSPRTPPPGNQGGLARRKTRTTPTRSRATSRDATSDPPAPKARTRASRRSPRSTRIRRRRGATSSASASSRASALSFGAAFFFAAFSPPPLFLFRPPRIGKASRGRRFLVRKKPALRDGRVHRVPQRRARDEVPARAPEVAEGRGEEGQVEVPGERRPNAADASAAPRSKSAPRNA